MDPVADMLNSIKNAIAVNHPTVSIPFSNLKYQIAQILEREGFVDKVEKEGRKNKRFIKIFLSYDSDNISKISGLRKISKPGQRIYVKAKDIKPVKSGFGISIISTSKGLMTDKEARKHKIGGELICEIW